MSINFAHSVRPNQGNERPSRVLFYDVESHLIDADKGKKVFQPFLWTMIYRRYRKGRDKEETAYFSGSDISNFWDIVESYTYKKTKTYLVSHHLEVDFMPLKGMIELPARGWKLEKLISHNRVLIMWWKKHTATLLVMNNGNLFDGSIEQWGKQLGIVKLDMPKEGDDYSKWVAYCMRDTEIVAKMWDTLLAFLDEHDLGNFRVTKAGLALSAYRHRFMPRDIAIHNHPEAILLERLSYRGGRFQALQIGKYNKSTYYSLDINSMYGYIMQTAKLPYELRGYKINPSITLLEYTLKKYSVIAEVDITPSEAIFPRVEEGKIVYKSGDLHTTLTTPELKLCLEQGWVKKIYRMSWYYDDTIFKDYATYFLELKSQYDRDNNQPMRQMTKLFLNSLYGKFGQKGYEDHVIGNCDPDLFMIIPGFDGETKQHYEIAYYGGKVHETVISEVGYNTLVAIATHITSYGRLQLYQLMKNAGFEHVYHVATDSLLVDEIGYQNLKNLIDPTTPGLLKLEGIYQSITIKDVNDVVKDEEVKIKGIPRKAVQIDENTYVITTWTRFTTLIKRGVLDHY
ncbi:MAG: DNA polymerase, partial [Caldisericia bacterium]|nr:DNA polymerase [Caldisericia bacterium]